MSALATSLLPTIKLTLRETSNAFDDEIKSYIDSCITDLTNSGMKSSLFPNDASGLDNMILQAIRYYCLSNYGLYNEDSDKYAKSYLSVKAHLLVQQKYINEDNN